MAINKLDLSMKIKLKRNLSISILLLRFIFAFITFIVILSLRIEKKEISIGLFAITAFISFANSLSYRKREKSLIKSIMDYFADRLLVDLSVLALVIKGAIPFWVLAVFLARDLMTITIGGILIYKDYQSQFKRTALGRINLFFQIIAIIPVLMGETDWYLIWISVVFTIASGIEALFKSEFRKIKRKNTIEEIRFANLIKFADTFTLLNAMFGLISIIFSMRGWYNTAAIMMLLAVAADFLDGKVARLMKEQSDFGRELDSLADTVSFGVAPAVFGFNLIKSPLAMIVFVIFLFCGILRLARFNIVEMKGAYWGMPITFNGILIPLIYFIGIKAKFYPYIYLALAVLMVSSIKIRKIF